jgi:hypothetical protein
MDSFIGKSLSLVTKAEIRYQGILRSIDMTGHTITLENGACDTLARKAERNRRGLPRAGVSAAADMRATRRAHEGRYTVQPELTEIAVIRHRFRGAVPPPFPKRPRAGHEQHRISSAPLSPPAPARSATMPLCVVCDLLSPVQSPATARKIALRRRTCRRIRARTGYCSSALMRSGTCRCSPTS